MNMLQNGQNFFSVCLFSNPGYKILFLLTFNEARISEWNLSIKQQLICFLIEVEICIIIFTSI